MITHYLHIGLCRARLSNSWQPTAEVYPSEDDAERDLPSIENYTGTLVVRLDAAGRPVEAKCEDWSDRLVEMERDRKLEEQYERGLRSRPAGV